MSESKEAGVPVDVIASVKLEAAAVARELAQAAGWRGGVPEVPVASGASPASTMAGHATYLRSLTIGRARVPHARLQGTVSVPARVVPRIRGMNVDEVLASVSARQAIAWEIEAVRQGLTLTEAVLMAVVRDA